MGKRRVLLIRLLLIVVVIVCLTHTSWGQEDDTVNVSHPSLAKSEFNHEDILNPAQRSLDRSIDLFNTVATVMGLLVALITVIVAIGGILGYFKSRQLEKYIEQAKESADEVKGYAVDAKNIVDKLKVFENKLDKIDEKVLVVGENVLPGIEEKIDGSREKAKHLPPLSKPFSEDQKRLLEEYGREIEFLEAFGVLLKPEDYLNRGVDLFQRDKYELALKAFDKAIELKSDYAVVWYNRGVALDVLDRRNEALEAYDKAIELKPDDADAWDSRGFALAKLAHYDEALKAFEKATELKPDLTEAWYNMAFIYNLKGDKEKALKKLSKAISLDAKYKEKAKRDEDFKNLWDNDDFKRIVS